MHMTRQNQSIKRENSENCIVTEYPMNHHALDFAIVKVSGRYPEKGQATNLKSDEIVYVHQGNGEVIVNDERHALHAGDVVLIESKERFVWNGHFELFISCHPAFTVEQHVVINENNI